MIYKIPVTWMVYGEYEVEAKSIEEAIKIVEDGKDTNGSLFLLPEGDYVNDSLRVNHDLIECVKRILPF